MDATERVRAELEILGLDASRHVMDSYTPFLDALGTVRSAQLLTRRAREELLVAGVKVATQTPPVRTGKRVVFATLDDATGPVDLALFEDAQERYAATVFHSWLLLVRGVVRRTGPRGVSINATGAWDLDAVAECWRGGGAAAVREMITASDGDGGRPAAPAARRVLVHASGYRVSPYADLRPPGEPAKDAPRKLWHSSPGSPG
jgi:error-prone DNA polymerase